MAEGLFGSPGLLALTAGAQVLAARERAIAQNLANVDTPGYRAVDVDFASAFRQVLAADAAGGTATAAVPLVAAPGAMRLDGNGVDVDQQMAAIAETSMRYAAVTEDLHLQLGLLRTAVSEGGASS
jgi:flagellar basal-body rod protein FlgB